MTTCSVPRAFFPGHVWIFPFECVIAKKHADSFSARGKKGEAFSLSADMSCICHFFKVLAHRAGLLTAVAAAAFFLGASRQ